MTETEPVDFFVYANNDDFYGALGPGAHENVAGTAYAYIRTLLGLIPPDQIDDPLVAVRIPHEFVHLVFDTAVVEPVPRPAALAQRGPGGLPERGLRLGRPARQVEDAAKSGTLIPLDGLTGQFPNGQDFFLAYSESVGAVDYMIRTYGKDALVTLIRSYAAAGGRTTRRSGPRSALDMTAFGDGLVQGRERQAADEVRPAAGAGRSGARGLGRGGAGGAGGSAAPGGQRRRAGRRRRRPARRAGRAPADAGWVVPSRFWRSSSRSSPRSSGRPAVARRVDGHRRDVTIRRLRAIPSWQITLGVALLALGFLIAAQLASEGPRVRYTTQERTPLVETANELQTAAGRAEGTDPRAARADPGRREPGRGLGRPRPRSSTRELQEARIAAGLIALTGTGIVIQLEDSKAPVPPDGNESDYLVGSRDIRPSSRSCGAPAPRRSRSTANGSPRPRRSSTSGRRCWSTRPT